MFNKEFLFNLFRILVLCLLQVFVFNHINFLGSYQPNIYLVFILFYPATQSRYALVLLAFVLGLSIDVLENTGGIHAFATTFIAYFRYSIIKLLSGKSNFEIDFFSFSSFSIYQWVFYLSILVLTHHFILLTLENFKFTGILTVFMNALITSGLTLTFVFIYKILFKNKVGI